MIRFALTIVLCSAFSALSAEQMLPEKTMLIQIELPRANHVLEQRTLRSPMNGDVVEQSVFPGEFFYDEPSLSITSLDPLGVEIEAVLSTDLFRSTTVHSEAVNHLERDQADPVEPAADGVDALLDMRIGSFGDRLMLPNDELAATSGQKCPVEFPLKSIAIELAEKAE